MSSDVAKQVRAALKARGLGPRQVSVRNDSYSMGSTVRVRIKAWAVALREVEATVRPFERVTRDEITGEILCGGNTHIDVAYESDAIAEVSPIIVRALAAGAHTFGTLELTDSDTQAGEADAYDAGADGRWIALLARDRSGPYLTRILAERGELAAVVEELQRAPSPAPATDTRALATAAVVERCAETLALRVREHAAAVEALLAAQRNLARAEARLEHLNAAQRGAA